MDPLKSQNSSSIPPIGPKSSIALQIESKSPHIAEHTTNNFIDDEIIQLVNDSKRAFPLLPGGAYRRPALISYSNPINGGKAYIIEDVHGSRITLEILADVLNRLKGLDPKETLFVLEGVKPDQVASCNISNSFHPNQICCVVANKTGANVINPVANIAQMSLVNAYMNQAERQGFSKNHALGGMMQSLVLSVPPSIQFDIPHAIDNLKKLWGDKVSIEEMYNAVEQSLDLDRLQVAKIMEAISDAPIDDFNNIQSVIDKQVADRNDVIGSIIIVYANQVFEAGQYSDCRSVFNKARKMWGSEAPEFEQIHNAFIAAIDDNSMEVNIELGQIRTEVGDRLTIENFAAELNARPNIKNIITIAGYNHSGGLVPVLESKGYQRVA